MFREIIRYIWMPVYCEEDQAASLRTKLKFVGAGWLVCLCTFLFSLGIIVSLDQFVVHVLHLPAVTDTLNNKTDSFEKRLGKLAFPVIVLIGPFFEECIFRLPLRLRMRHVALFACMLLYFFSNSYLESSNPLNFKTAISMAVGIVSALVVWYWLPLKSLERFKGKYFHYLFYFSAICFGLIHITNFSDPHFTAGYLYPLYTLPQFCMGLVLGTVRMRYGFGYALLLHALINLPPAIATLF